MSFTANREVRGNICLEGGGTSARKRAEHLSLLILMCKVYPLFFSTCHPVHKRGQIMCIAETCVLPICILCVVSIHGNCTKLLQRVILKPASSIKILL